MATNKIAEDKTTLTIQIPKTWREALDAIAKKESASSVGELIRKAIEARYFSRNSVDPNTSTELQKAIEVGSRAAMSYLENKNKPLYQMVAEDHAKYGSKIKNQVSRPKSHKTRRKKPS